MKALPGNPHANAAIRHGMVDDSAALSDSLLAIAYELRTTTLMKLLQSEALRGEAKAELDRQVTERLGLGEQGPT